MPLQTTVIGSYPSPEYLHIPRWFPNATENGAAVYTEFTRSANIIELNKCIEKAECEVIEEQIQLGIDVITDGELRRENYIWYFCRKIKAFDFNTLQRKECRKGAWATDTPVIVSRVDIPDDVSWIADEWKKTQAKSSRPVKITLPGPLTIIGTTTNNFYTDEKELSMDLATVINAHILALVEAGCQHIQIDEPVFAREPDKALAYGIDHAALCFKDVATHVSRYIHLCRGYPYYIDQDDYVKADPIAYFKLADKLDVMGFNGVSIEDAECNNDLCLLDRFKISKVIIGSVAIAKSRVESTEEIRARLLDVLKHVPADRLIVAPDCGLGYLPREILRQKLTNMVAAAKSLP